MFAFICLVLVTLSSAQDAYMSARDSFVEAQSKQTLSARVTMTENELEANDILASLLLKEASIMGDNYPPAMNFFKARPWILNTSVLFPFIQTMPKGVIHHVHFESSATYNWVIKNLTYSPNCYIYEGEPNGIYTEGALHMFANPPSSKWVGVNEKRALRNADEFDDELLASLTMEDVEYESYVAFWNKFDQIFGRVDGLMYYKDGFEGYMVHMIAEMLADGVQNIEIKLSPMTTLYDLQGNTYNFDYIARFVYQMINKTRQAEPYFTMKVVLADERSNDHSSILPVLELSLEYRNKYPDLVVGFDLDGPEDEGHTLLYFLEDFNAITNLSKNYDYKLEYYFHAGETLMANNSNIIDAVLLNCYRIGHAFQLQKFPLLIDLVAKKGTGIEVCPISNQILQYSYDLRLHPAFEYFNRGLNMTISSDDPAIYGYGGVSFDWYEIALAWNLDIAGLKQLALNSYIKGSFFTEEERARARSGFDAKWDAWIDRVVSTTCLSCKG